MQMSLAVIAVTSRLKALFVLQPNRSLAKEFLSQNQSSGSKRCFIYKSSSSFPYESNFSAVYAKIILQRRRKRASLQLFMAKAEELKSDDKLL